MPAIRPCSATLFKRILVLENGVMAENGIRDELSRTSGVYGAPRVTRAVHFWRGMRSTGTSRKLCQY